MNAWMSDNPTRQRTRSGQYSVEEMVENIGPLQRTLGRIPTKDEIMMDMICALTSDMTTKGEKQFRAEGKSS